MKGPVLITGGSGLLGVNWAQKIRHERKTVLGMHNRFIELSGTESTQLELTDESRLFDQIRDLNPVLVIHTVALTNIELCERDQESALYINANLAANVAKVCTEIDCKLVFISTDQLFDGRQAFVSESCPVSPLNVYGKTKAVAEEKVLASNPQALIIRTNFFGWGPSYRQSFSDFIISNLRNSNPITLFDDVSYTPIIVDELVNCVHALIEANASGVFNVVGGEAITKYDFGMMLAEEFDLDKRFIEQGVLSEQSNMTQRPFDMSLSNKKLGGVLGTDIPSLRRQVSELRRKELDSGIQEILTLT